MFQTNDLLKFVDLIVLLLKNFFAHVDELSRTNLFRTPTNETTLLHEITLQSLLSQLKISPSTSHHRSSSSQNIFILNLSQQNQLTPYHRPQHRQQIYQLSAQQYLQKFGQSKI